MKLIKSSLEATLADICANHADQLPADNSKQTYFLRYSNLADKLNRDFHAHVGAGSAASDGGMLTDHGPDHIQTVINRAATLLDNSENTNNLTGYEIYILLCAIHFHDLGNIHGREKHEKRVSEMMSHVASHLGDAVEKNTIRQVAEAHGGKVGGESDTISYLPRSSTVNGMDIRPSMLAAILRFSDELADDSLRANRALQALDAIPKSSIIYHKYASCLHSVMSRDSCKSVELHYDVNIEEMKSKFPKMNPQTKRFQSVYLLDEILERLHKMYLERLYCNRFMAPVVHVHSIVVKIRTTKADEKIGEEMPQIDFRLEELGYPDSSSIGVHAYSEELTNWKGKGKKLTGNFFVKSLRKLEAAR